MGRLGGTDGGDVRVGLPGLGSLGEALLVREVGLLVLQLGESSLCDNASATAIKLRRGGKLTFM